MDRSLPILVLLAACSLWAACGAVEPGPAKPSGIFIYVTSDTEDSCDFYSGRSDLDPVRSTLTSAGYEVTVHDDRSLPSLASVSFDEVDQFWLVEGDCDSDQDVKQGEAQKIRRFYSNGGSVWISTENADWTEDTNPALGQFDVQSEGTCNSMDAAESVEGNHPIFDEVDRLRFDSEFGSLSVENDDAEVVWKFNSDCPTIAVLDGTDSGAGRVIMESGWTIGYAYYDGPGNANLPFMKSGADWLSK